MEDYVTRNFPSMQKHHFTIAYTPWSNGTVERVMRDIISLFRKILHKSNDIDFDSWPFFLPHVMAHLNGRRQTTLGERSPRELLLGKYEDFDLDIMFDPELDKLQNIATVPSYDQYYKDLCESLQQMHKNVISAKQAIHKINVNGQRVTNPVNFGIGDFVLVAIVSRKQRKLQAQWRGPYRVIGCVSSHVYTCEDLTLNITLDVHVSRMKFFATSDMDVSVALADTIRAQDTWNTEYVPEMILDSFITSRNEVYVKIKWSGFSELESTMEPLKSFYADAPELVHAFLKEHPHRHEHLRSYVENILKTKETKKNN
jgi:hypothetical protein